MGTDAQGRERTVVLVKADSEGEYAYLAGILDGEGSFVVNRNTNAFGIKVAVTDEVLIDWLHARFAGTVSRAGVTKAGNRVFTWVLQRRADQRHVLPRLLPWLTIKQGQAQAMIALLEHLEGMPRWDSRPTKALSSRDPERKHRRDVRAAWVERGEELREAVRAARPRQSPLSLN
jgi:hypothetical protein